MHLDIPCLLCDLAKRRNKIESQGDLNIITPWQRRLVATVALSFAGLVFGQQPAATKDASVQGAQQDPPVGRVLPANTLISLQFDESLDSGTTIKGSTFRMQVAEDVLLGGKILIPAGTPAIGEVVDSQKSRMLGKAGVLVLSARLIRLDQRDIRLHSALGAAGESMVMASMFVPFIRGWNATVEQGTRVTVRTATDEVF